MLDKTIVIVFGIVFILSICLGMFGIVFTLVQEIQFDAICRNTLIRIDLDGGLTDASRYALTQSLTNKGYEDIRIHAPKNIRYGDMIVFNVTAKGVRALSIGVFNMLGLDGEMHYEGKIISRKIHNLAFQ